MPVYVHVIDHPEARVLVDTGMTDLHPLVADMDPRLRPLSEQDIDLAGIDIVVNTHLHFDHCGGNHLFSRQADLRPAPGARRRARRGRLHRPRVGRGSRRGVRAGRRRARAAARAPARPGAGRHPGMQVVVIETGGRPRVVGGTWRSGSASSTTRRPKASCVCSRSTLRRSGSRTCASRGDLAAAEAARDTRGAESRCGRLDPVNSPQGARVRGRERTRPP